MVEFFFSRFTSAGRVTLCSVLVFLLTPSAHTLSLIIPYYCMSTYSYANDYQSFWLYKNIYYAPLFPQTSNSLFEWISFIAGSPSPIFLHSICFTALGVTRQPVFPYTASIKYSTCISLLHTQGILIPKGAINNTRQRIDRIQTK